MLKNRKLTFIECIYLSPLILACLMADCISGCYSHVNVQIQFEIYTWKKVREHFLI